MDIMKGIFETHLNVSNLKRAMEFYGEQLGLTLGKFEEDCRVAFYLINENDQSMIGLWEKSTVHLNHFAFRVGIEDIDRMLPFLQRAGIENKSAFGCGTDEPIVFPWLATASIYVTDPDGNSLEMIAMLPDKPRGDIGKVAISLSEWNSLHKFA